jgi:signal peptidase I
MVPLPCLITLQFITQVLNLACIVFSALMIWKGLMCVTKSESPVVVVLR